MEYLPDEIIKIIYDFLPTVSKMLLTKKLFNSHYYIINKKKKITKKYHNYLRFLIQKKCYLHFDIILHIHCGKFISIKKWKYKNSTYPNFLVYLKEYALKNNSQNCYEMIKKLLEPSKKNKYKRIRTRNIRWSN